MKAYHKSIDKNMVYTYSDFDSDVFVKKLFDMFEVPIGDSDLPSMFILDFERLGGKHEVDNNFVLIYHYPGDDHYAEPLKNLVVYEPQLITNFVLKFF